ncbi:hypothetical protein XH90_04305 [Bradyrhizobium sp. CCBAU 53338]|nr:hypothetical protein XH90_04305 [Bradyrhizobium sp. CCBAU 53338]
MAGSFLNSDRTILMQLFAVLKILSTRIISAGVTRSYCISSVNASTAFQISFNRLTAFEADALACAGNATTFDISVPCLDFLNFRV